MRSRFSLFLLVFLLAACGQNERVKVLDDNGALIQDYRRDKKDFAKNGAYKAFYPDGKKLEEARYVRDTLDGVRKRYYPNGQVEVAERYLMGRFEGLFQSFYESGQLELEGNYVDNAMTGVWKRYHKNGQLMEEVLFADNQENGPFMEYHENGKIKAKGAYLNGDNEHGLLELFDQQGVLERKMNCEMGVCNTIWIRDSTNLQE